MAAFFAAGFFGISRDASAFGPAGGYGGTNGHGGTHAPRVTGPIKVEKAQGKNAYTVEEVFTKGPDLDNRPAAVRGKVVKVSKAIMGKNWIHLRDGTGDESKGTHDLVVTSQDLPTVGDVVTAKGTLHRGRDFGYGYRYEMILEEAAITR